MKYFQTKRNKKSRKIYPSLSFAKRVGAKFRLARIGLGVLFLFLLAFQVTVGNALASYGRELKFLEQKKESLRQENESLRAEVAALGSLTRLRREAQLLGFRESGDRLEYLRPPKLASR